MIQINVTQKLLKKFELNENGHLPQEPHRGDARESSIDINPLRDWHANLVIIQRRNCVMLVHDRTRFPVFVPCLTKKNFAMFQREFEFALMNTILKCDATEKQMDTAQRLLEKIQIGTNCNRSVQGTVNSMIQDLKHMGYYDDFDVTQITGHRIGAHLADTPCGVKGSKEHIWPKNEMLAVLDLG